MPIYKLLKNNEVVNTIVADDPPEITEEYDSVELIILEPSVSVSIPISPQVFKSMFTNSETELINTLRPDKIIDSFYDIIDSPICINVDRNSPLVQEFLNYLVHKNIISQDRAKTITNVTL